MTDALSANTEYDRLLNEMISESLSAAVDDPISSLSLEEATASWLDFARQCTIISGVKIVRFDPYDYQIDAFQQIWTHRGTIFGKVRQMGLTELVSNIFLWKASLSRAYSAAVFSQTGDDTGLISERVKLMASSHPNLRTRKANTKEIALFDGGKILFRTSTGEGARGLPSLTDLLCDEWAYVSEDKKIWGAATPAQAMVGDRARTIVVSTPPAPGVECEYKKMLMSNNGDRDVYKITKDMREGNAEPVVKWTDENGWCKFFAHWRAHPVYSNREDHLGQTQRDNNLPESTLQREHNLDFDAKPADATINLEWFPRFAPGQLPEDPWLILQSWDTAQTDNPRSSDWAGITLLCYGPNIYLADGIINKYLSPDGQEVVKKFAQKWKPHHVLIENKSSGLDIIPRLRDDPSFPYPIVQIEPLKGRSRDGDPKVLRFEQELGVIKDDHRVWLPTRGSGHDWLSKAEKSLEDFPSSKKRDFPDTLSQALKYIREYERTALTGAVGSYDPFLNGKKQKDNRLLGIL